MLSMPELTVLLLRGRRTRPRRADEGYVPATLTLCGAPSTLLTNECFLFYFRLQGAAFTFNAPSYTAFIRALRASPPPPSIPFPTFDHALKDPLPSPHPIQPHHRVVVVEGLYTLLDADGWREAAGEMDERVWVECEAGVARARLVARHLESGVEEEVGAAERRGEWAREGFSLCCERCVCDWTEADRLGCGVVVVQWTGAI